MPLYNNDNEFASDNLDLNLTSAYEKQIEEEVRIANEAQLRIWKEEAEQEALLSSNKKPAPPATPTDIESKNDQIDPPAGQKPQTIILPYEPVAAAGESVSELKFKVAEYQNQILSLQNELEKAEARLKEKPPVPLSIAGESIFDLKIKVNRYQDQIVSLQDELELAKTRLKEKPPVPPAAPGESVSELKIKVIKCQDQIVNLQDELEIAKARLKEKPPVPPSAPGESVTELKNKITAHQVQIIGLQNELEKANARLKEKPREEDSQIVRLNADIANLRKKAEKDRIDAIRYGKQLIIEQMIGIHGKMVQKIKQASTGIESKSLKEGFELIVKEFDAVLKSEGIESINALGQTFNPYLHEAIEIVEARDEKENNIVLEEFEKGYVFEGRLLRPAKVKIGKINK